MSAIIDWIVTPMSYAFMVRGLAAALIVGVVCAVLGTFVVLRGMAFLGDALSHAILPALAVGYLVGGGARGPLFWWALGTGGGHFTGHRRRDATRPDSRGRPPSG